MRANDPDHRAMRRAVAEQTMGAISASGYSVMSSATQKLSPGPLIKGTTIISADIADMDKQVKFVVDAATFISADAADKDKQVKPDKQVELDVHTAPFNSADAADMDRQVKLDEQVKLDVHTAPLQLRHVRGTVYEIAVELSLEGTSVLAVNAASAYHSGGGFRTGGRHALEESMCMQSTLYVSLQEGERLATVRATKHPAEHCPAHANPPTQPDGKAWHRHVPVGGAIVSPGVEVFRGGTNDGYPFWSTPVRLAGVASIAVFNKNERISDSPLDSPQDQDEYMRDLRRMFSSVLMSARACGATVLVIPDAGCGVFRNDPQQVGRALGEALCGETYGVLKVFISGRKEFFAGVQAAATKAVVATIDWANRESKLEQREAGLKIQALLRGRRERLRRSDCSELPA